MTRYRPLFHLDVTHDYFLSRGSVVFEAQADADRAALANLYSVADFLEIVPDDATLSVLSGHRMIFRATAGGCFVAVQLDPSASDTRPAVPPADDFRLTLVLRLIDRRFPNYTELGPATTGFYRFGNDALNRTAGVNFLSRRVPAFDPLRRYVAGDIRSQAAGPTFDVFRALRDSGPSAAPVAADWTRIPPDTFNAATTYQTGALVLFGNRLFRALVDSPGTDLGNAAQWQPAGVLGNQYVTVTDAVLPVSGLFDLDISDGALSQATVRLFRSNSSVVVKEQTFAAGQGTLGPVQIDLRGLPPGPYRVEVLDGAGLVVPGLGSPIYLAPRARSDRWFGVVEIARGTADYALFNADGTLRAPRYALRFLNRATRWRYIFPAAQPVGAGADVAPEAGDSRILVTGAPLSLTRFGGGSRLQADSPATSAVSEEVLLPAPDVERIRRQNAEWFSETHVPNFTVGP
jgi:hypothetical protein